MIVQLVQKMLAKEDDGKNKYKKKNKNIITKQIYTPRQTNWYIKIVKYVTQITINIISKIYR